MDQALGVWATFNRYLFGDHELVATGTTGTLLEEQLGMGALKLGTYIERFTRS